MNGRQHMPRWCGWSHQVHGKAGSDYNIWEGSRRGTSAGKRRTDWCTLGRERKRKVSGAQKLHNWGVCVCVSPVQYLFF